MKIRFLILSIFYVSISFGQKSDSNISDYEISTNKKPVSFSHAPFLLLKINPSNIIGINNAMGYGIELAPPIGKFSFSFDYGLGKGSWNPNKFIRKNQAENKNTVIRGEIRTYFSDWYPFYALDKKPFGRYYALEYVQGKYNRNLEMATGIGGNQLPSYAQFNDVIFNENTRTVHLKIGKHIHISRFLFIDVFAGIGLGNFTVSVMDKIISKEPDQIPLHFSFLSNRTVREPNTKGWYFSTTSGFRLALPL